MSFRRCSSRRLSAAVHAEFDQMRNKNDQNCVMHDVETLDRRRELNRIKNVGSHRTESKNLNKKHMRPTVKTRNETKLIRINL